MREAHPAFARRRFGRGSRRAASRSPPRRARRKSRRRRRTSIGPSRRSSRRRACARTPAPAATSPTRRATRSATSTCRPTTASSKRRDLLLDYGPYGQPALLVKNVAAVPVEVQTFDGQKVDDHDRHQARRRLDPRSRRERLPDAAPLDRQRRDREQLRRAARRTSQRTPCTDVVPGAARFDPTKDPPDAGLRARSATSVNAASLGAVVRRRATATAPRRTSCTSRAATSPSRSAGTTSSPSDYLAQTPEQSELLRRPLAPSQGGAFHEGGIVFNAHERRRLPGALSDWAKEHGPPTSTNSIPGFAFFAHKVQPILVKKGCMMLQCHSASMFHDYRLRGGSGGSFSLSATRQNYDLSIAQLSLESDDPEREPHRSEEPLPPGDLRRRRLRQPGIAHRGGPLLEDFGETRGDAATACDDAIARAVRLRQRRLDKIPAYCVIREWLRRERDGAQARAALRDRLREAPARARRSTRRRTSTCTRRARTSTSRQATLGAIGDVTTSARHVGDRGLRARPGDRRHPPAAASRGTATHVAFAARSSATEPLAVYEMNADGTACAKHADINAGPATRERAPHPQLRSRRTARPTDGAMRPRLRVDARQSRDPTPTTTTGPQRTPADPTKPNANLYVVEPDPASRRQTRIRQLTYLLNMERYPSFMSDGRVIFDAEKRAPSFYQLALRRINLDGGDYHPLYAQRGTIGYPRGDARRRARRQELRGDLPRSGTPHGGGALGRLQSLDRHRFHEHEPGRLPDRSGRDRPERAAAARARLLPALAALPRSERDGAPGSRRPASTRRRAPLPGGQMLVSFGAASDPARSAATTTLRR